MVVLSAHATPSAVRVQPVRVLRALGAEMAHALADEAHRELGPSCLGFLRAIVPRMVGGSAVETDAAHGPALRIAAFHVLGHAAFGHAVSHPLAKQATVLDALHVARFFSFMRFISWRAKAFLSITIIASI